MSNTISNGFKELRKLGYFCRQNYWCCQTCGWSDIPEDKSEKVVFFHNQDNDDKKRGNPFYLCWSGDGNLICEVLKKHGVETDWNGNDSTRIRVVSW